jgi:hypothetical protein
MWSVTVTALGWDGLNQHPGVVREACKANPGTTAVALA